MSGPARVVVIGAGLAGASAALGLARRGQAVTLIEKAALPRDKVCGCCLNAHAIASLNRLGLDVDRRWPNADRLRGVRLSAGGRVGDWPIRGSLAVSRSALDSALIDLVVDAGVELIDQAGARVLRGEDTDAGVKVHVRRHGAEQVLDAALVVVADGLSGSSLRDRPELARVVRPGSYRGYGAWLAAGSEDHGPGWVRMRCGSAGYVGSVVLEDGRVDVAAAMDPAFVKQSGGPGAAAAAIAEQAGERLAIAETTAWRATAALTGRRPGWARRVLVVGDAAGYVEPFTGEGMAWALRSGEAVVPFAVRVLETGWRDPLGVAWHRAQRRLLGPAQLRCRLVAGLLRRPTLCRAAVRVLSVRTPRRDHGDRRIEVCR